MSRDDLSKEIIIQAAIELLDAEGLEGLSMRRLGDRLDAAATAMYWYVTSKSHLLILASNEVWGEVVLPDLDRVDWRTAAADMAGGLHRMVSQHPWLVTAFASQPVYGENKARHDDRILAVYEKAGFVGAEVDDAATTVFMFVLGHALGGSTSDSLNRQLSRGSGNSQSRVQQSLEEAKEVALRFPRLRERLEGATETGYGSAPGRSFEFGLRAVLDGLEHRIRTRPLPPSNHAVPVALNTLQACTPCP
ncbi:TetR/AcrR family transcriptional regulator [Streptacidiphilus pinicola]|uniref:TetR/AcrR family transcriptional regulator n=1 Tax=Streptacidiphilus pinicola TaxID=2219663 RepID=A0A2X0IJ35_9ACTN|nr:TetR/AcrR family transcriptional regulator C-terminal domain-containing protein [Streptacidiphilus pinicola]RAG85042.1 TetR/AcrR family transcriptional regulator [Streptacidiphilus pinicola]